MRAGRATPLAAAVVLWVAAPPLFLLHLSRPSDEDAGRAAALPAVVGEWERSDVFALSERWYGLLGTRDVAWATYEDAKGGRVQLIAVFHGANWKSVHPPGVCLRGDGFTLDSSASVSLDLPGQDVPVRLGRMAATREGRTLLGYYAFGTASLLTPSYTAFFLHHAPRALLRSPAGGFLLRVETWVDGDWEEAEDRCARFLAAVLPAVREAVR